MSEAILQYNTFTMVNIDNLLAELTLEEKVSLLAGADTWRTAAIPRLNIPSVKVKYISLAFLSAVYAVANTMHHRCRTVPMELEVVSLPMANQLLASLLVLLWVLLSILKLLKRSVPPLVMISSQSLLKSFWVSQPTFPSDMRIRVCYS
jgi:hypothetical protein